MYNNIINYKRNKNEECKVDNIKISLKHCLIISIMKVKFIEIFIYDYFETGPKLSRLFPNKVYSSTS